MSPLCAVGYKQWPAWSKKVLANKKLKMLAAKRAVQASGKVMKKGSKAISKAIPFVGAIVTLFGLKQDVEAKGVTGGVTNSVLDAIPIVGTGKAIAEIITGKDLIPDLPQIDLSHVILELEDIPHP